MSSRNRKNGVLKKIKIRKNKTKERNNRERKNSKSQKNLLRKILTIILGLGIFIIFSIAAFMFYIVISCGSFDPEALKNQDQTVIYDKDGNQFATLGAEKRESVSYDELPQVLIDAIVATEDSRYYQHNGVDMARFLKASFLQVLGKSDAGGASTLTMQVVKNNLTETTSSGLKGIIRKFKDVYLSVFFMEKRYTKGEILEMYVNDSCLGGTIYGVGEASKYYFGKTVSELTLPEATLLAGMYQAPNRYNPYKSPEEAYKRRNTVLSLMVRHGYITKEEKDMANSVSIESMLKTAIKEDDYQGYIDTVIEEVTARTGDNPAKVSMKIYTALDKTVQDGINKVLNDDSYDYLWKDEEIQSGVAVTNVNDGTIVAIGAGRNRTAGDWNYATQSHRQPGSTAKPLFDYGPGFEYNDFSTYTLFNDEAWSYTNGPEVGNWDGAYQGLITLRQALSVSRNIPALKAFQQVDKKNIATFVNGLGLDIAYSTSSDNYKVYDNGADNLLNEAYSIGGMSYGVTPLDMAEAYACFANGGYHIESHAVTKIEYRDSGKVVEFDEDKEKIMSDSTSYLMNNVLKYAVDYQFNGGAKRSGYTVAAKTGTSNLDDATTRLLGIPSGSVNDLWTVAYTPEYSIALWYGYPKVDKTHYLSSASAPKDAVMKALIQYVPMTTKQWEMPSSVVSATVEKETWPAKLPSENTPGDLKITEYFKKGTQPTETSERFAKLPAVTNIKTTKSNDGYKITWSWKTPNQLDETYLKKYFSSQAFGNASSRYLENRLNETVHGFGIYVKNSFDKLDKVTFVKENEYLYKPKTNGNIEIVIKAEYQNSSYSNMTSEASSTIIKVDSADIEDDLKITLKGDNGFSLIKGTNYIDDGITVTYNGKDVTTSSTITYQINSTKFTSKNDLEEKVSTLDIGDYEIIYNITYKDNKTTITRKIKIIEG